MTVKTPSKPKVEKSNGIPVVELSTESGSTTRLPNGAACAALMAAGIGVLFLGLMTTGAELFAGLKTALNLYDPVGPLAGKTIVAVLAQMISWPILHSMWKERNLDFDRYFMYSMILVGIGFILTFPPVFEAFAH